MLERHTISSGYPKLLFSQGDIFDNRYGFDGIVLFIPPTVGLSLYSDYEYFKRNRELYIHSTKVYLWVYNWRVLPEITANEIDFYVNLSLCTMLANNCKRIGFHGIRTYDIDEYECEQRSIQAVYQLQIMNEIDIDIVTMVDANGGYNFHLLRK